MGKIAPGAILPTRNAFDPIVPDTEADVTSLPEHYLEYVMTRATRNLDRIAQWYGNQARLVEEFAGESAETATGESVLTAIPDYEPSNERITSVLVTGPPSTPFVLELGSRYMSLATDATGKCLLAPVAFTLTPQSKRLLTAGALPAIVTPSVQDGNNAAVTAAGGNVALPNATDSLTGFTISLSTVSTALMTVTVSNVKGGPYVYTVPIGGQILNITYPTPLLAVAGAPTVTWSAALAAVGNASIFGLTAPGSAVQAPGSWFLQLSGYALGNVRQKN
jgi:hypothetical protein